MHNGKLELQEEYNKKAKDLEIANRVARSSAVSESRVSKMQARDALLEDLRKGTLAKLAKFCKSGGYETFVKQLIIEGLIKIEESEVEVQCRAKVLAVRRRAADCHHVWRSSMRYGPL